MAKLKKTAGKKLMLHNDSRQRRDVVLKGRTVLVLRGKSVEISPDEVSDQLQSMLGQTRTYGLRLVEVAKAEAEEPSDDDKEDGG